MKREEVQTFLDSIPLLTELTTSQQSEFWQAVNHPGFRHLLGLLLATRQGLYVQLSKVPLSDPLYASVLQGRISAVETISELVLEQGIENPAPADERI